jgi:decaprenylphospho-beta-D-erythro-pentofuranosid-2-ulose 2-reductase
VSGNVLVLGATSAIGRAFARRLAADGHDLVLAGRRRTELERDASDLRVRHGVEVETHVFEALRFETHAAFFEDCTSCLPTGLHGLVVCHGDMADQEDAQRKLEVARRMLDVNYTSAVSILERAATYFEARGRGWICAVSSVAGDRGRPSNYLYGASKAALSTALQGLRARLARAGVSVVDVRPGFVDTRLTYGRPGLFLVASPDRVAKAALRGIRRDRAVVYAPWFWAGIMLVIRLLPDRVFKRMRL